jgi:hypothetical protein
MNYDGKTLIQIGLAGFLLSIAYKILVPIINWFVYLIPTISIIMIIFGIIKLSLSKNDDEAKKVIQYGVIVLVISMTYKFIVPLVSWFVYLIPSVCFIIIIIGVVKIVLEK